MVSPIVASLETVQAALSAYDEKLALTKRRGEATEECRYTAIGTVPLPHKGRWQAPGHMQIYFTFNEDKITTNQVYEIYYNGLND